MTEPDTVRYPVGPFQPRSSLTPAEREELIAEVAHFPADLRFLVAGLSEEQIDSSYREGGWTVRQVVHHLADSHMNAFIRCKLALTEDRPTIKPYKQAPWGELADARGAPVTWSLDLLEVLHQRWVLLLGSLSDADFQRVFLHPEMGEVTLERTLQLYVWHGRHHLGHVRHVPGG
jgi:uncharacterized damage-inducible protein DinB